MTENRLDHVAIGAAKISDAEPVLVRDLGGVPYEGGPSQAGFTWQQFTFGGGGRLEVLEPLGSDGFMHRFLASRGPGIHHVTFDVPDLDVACDRARALGYDIIGYRSDPGGWSEAFLHPKQAHGIVIQLAQEPDAHESPDPAASIVTRVLGVSLRLQTLEAARTQFGTLLQGTESTHGEGELEFHWPESPLRVAIELDPSADEGPTAIDLAAPSPLPTSDWTARALGTRFRVIGPTSRREPQRD